MKIRKNAKKYDNALFFHLFLKLFISNLTSLLMIYKSLYKYQKKKRINMLIFYLLRCRTSTSHL